MTDPDHGLSKDTVRADMARACAIVHGRGAKLSLLELCVLVMKDGLLNEREREELLERKLSGDTLQPVNSADPLHVRAGDTLTSALFQGVSVQFDAPFVAPQDGALWIEIDVGARLARVTKFEPLGGGTPFPPPPSD